MDYKWSAHNDQCGSGHFHVFININKPIAQDTVPKWKMRKADWNEFERLAIKCMIEIASQTIPKSSANPKSIPKL